MTVLISTPVQLFICWRINILNGSKLITGIIVFFALCSFVGGVAVTTCVTIIPEFTRIQEFEEAAIIWLSSSAIADIIITLSLVWSLHTHKTGNSESDSLINKIIRITLQTGALTTTFAILDVLMYVTIKNSTWQFLWDFPLGKLYTNSLLSTLNARRSDLDRSAQPNVLFKTSQESRDQNRRVSTRQASSFSMGEIQFQKPIPSLANISQYSIGGDVEAGHLPHGQSVRREWQ